jgi:DNA-binding response OmpR family regulator
LTTRPSLTLLTGEDPTTNWAADAREWLSIYRQLLSFNEQLLERLRQTLVEENGHSAMDEAKLERELGRLREQVAFWEGRYRELSAAIDIDEERGILFGGGVPYRLSLRERQLLLWLLHHPDRYFTPTNLANLAWNEPALSAEQVRSYVVRLRRLLDRAQAQCRIESRRGHGYRLTFAADESAEVPGLVLGAV